MVVSVVSSTDSVVGSVEISLESVETVGLISMVDDGVICTDADDVDDTDVVTIVLITLDDDIGGSVVTEDGSCDP